MEKLDGFELKKCRTGDGPAKNRRLDEMQKMNELIIGISAPKGNEARYLSPHEVDSLLMECDEVLRGVILIALYTGMTQKEILPLSWSQIDLKRREIAISSLYTLPLNKIAMNILQENLDGADKSGYVFASENGEMLSNHDIGRALRVASSAAGIGMVRFHDLRYTFAANLLRAGVDCHLVGRMLEHKTAGAPVSPLRLIAKPLRRAIESLDKINIYGANEYRVYLKVPVKNMDEYDAVIDRLNYINETWDNDGSYKPHGWVMRTKKDAFELGNKLKKEFADIPGTSWHVTNGPGKRLSYAELIDFDK